MRVLTIIDSLAVGGAEQSLAALAPHLIAMDVDLHVAYHVPRVGIGPELETAGATLHSVAGGRGRLVAVLRTRNLIKRIGPDLVHTTLFESDIVGRTAAWLTRTPVVSSFVTEAYGPEHRANPEYRAWKVRAAQVVDAATARVVRRFHAVSAASADVMAERLRINRSQVDVIARGRDVAKLGTRTEKRRIAVRDGLGIPRETPIVVAAARHFHFKGLDILVDAFPEVVDVFPEARLLIAGRPGPSTAEIEERIQRGGIADSTSLLGYRNDVPDLMSAADVFVLPSRVEGSPGALIEAMALGIPAVATDIPSVRELVGVGDNLVAVTPSGAPADMAAAIVDLLADPVRATNMAEAAQRRFQECCSMDVIATATLDLYKRALAG